MQRDKLESSTEREGGTEGKNRKGRSGERRQKCLETRRPRKCDVGIIKSEIV